MALNASKVDKLIINVSPSLRSIDDILKFLREKKQKTKGLCDNHFLTISIAFWTQLNMMFQIQGTELDSDDILMKYNLERLNQHYKKINVFVDKYPDVHVCQCGKVCANIFEAMASFELQLCDCSK